MESSGRTLQSRQEMTRRWLSPNRPKVKRRSPALPFHKDAARPAYACNDKWRQAGAVDSETTQMGVAGIESNASPPGAPESFPPRRNHSNRPGVSSAEDGPVPFN